MIGINWEEFALRFTEAVAHFMWIGALLAVIMLGVDRLFVRTAAGRHRTLFVGMLLMALSLPICFVFSDSSQPGSQNPPIARSAVFGGSSPVLEPFPDGTTIASPGAAVRSEDTLNSSTSAASNSETVGNAPWLEHSAPWVVTIYLSGLLVMMARLVLGLLGTGTLRRRSEPVYSGTWTDAMQRMGTTLGLKTQPLLAWSKDVASPVLIGLVKPVVLIPIALASRLTPNQLEAVLAHELAHLRRRDSWAVTVQRIIETILFFHPAVWWMSRQVEHAREEACDDLVVAMGRDPADYAEALVRCSEMRLGESGGTAHLATKLSATGRGEDPLRRRILRILGHVDPVPVRPGRLGWVLGGMALAGVLLASAADTGEHGDLADRAQEGPQHTQADDARIVPVRVSNDEIADTNQPELTPADGNQPPLPKMVSVTGEPEQPVEVPLTASEDKTDAPDEEKIVPKSVHDPLQKILDEELARALAEYRSEAGTIILMNPNTGEVLAMAARADPAANPPEGVAKAQFNPAIHSVYEPGSTFKVVAISGALDQGLVDPDTLVFCHHGMLVEGRNRIPDHHPYGHLSVQQVVQKSSNIGTYKLSRMLGQERFAAHALNLGFTKPSGINLAGEASGVMADMTNAVNFSRTTYGYGVGVTPIQIANAYCAIANGGTLMRPWIVDATPSPDDTAIEPGKPVAIRRVMKEETARQMRQALATACTEKGTASRAAVEGHQVAGKTGTSLKIKPGGHGFHENRYVTSFVGMLPADNPEFVCLVLIDDPRTKALKRYGGTIAAPVFSKIASRVAQAMDIPASAAGAE